ncbi:MAG: spore germination protein GerW family protein [Chloroflexota bacterium]|nr:spore germination protein GerW family protein [Chloroflexota bacterium]
MNNDPAETVRDALAGTVGRIPSIATAEVVVGPVQEENGRIAIPLASVAAGFGLGLGAGHEGGDAVDRDDASAPRGSGGGGGGGGGAKARPVAVVELTEDDLQVHQVVDSTRIAVASLALAGWCVFWITRTIRAFRRR